MRSGNREESRMRVKLTVNGGEDEMREGEKNSTEDEEIRKVRED